MNPYVKTGLIWGGIAFGLSIVMIVFNTAPIVLSASFMVKVGAVLVGTTLGTASALLGDLLRRIAMPAGYFTTGGMTSLLWLKFFWAIGPQLIGVLVGTFFGIAWVLS